MIERQPLLPHKPGRPFLSLLLFAACEAQLPHEPAPAPATDPQADRQPEPEPPTLAPVSPDAPANPLRLILKPRARLSTLARTRPGDLGARLLRSFPALGGVEIREVSDGSALTEVIQRYWQSGDYEYVEPDYTIRPLAAPNDPRYADGTQWSLNNTGQAGGTADADIDAPEAWNTRTDASSVVVAVVDGGINYTHEDLVGNLWVNPGEIAGNGIDDDRNGYVDDVYGINAITRTGDPRDDTSVGHGSHVSGIIGAVGNNGKGISGVAWKVKLLACKIFASNGAGDVSSAVACVDYARANGAKVINMSFEGPYSYALRDAIVAARASGILVVAAAGNGARNTDGVPAYPAGYDLDNVLAVASTGRTDALAPSSNYGAASVDLAAPGEEIFSTHNASNTAYVTLSGTSMAAPHVSGALALMIAQSPASTYTQIINRLLTTTDKPAALAGKTRSGRLNLARALGSTATRPINDNFSGRSSYPAGACLAGGSNVDATAETGEPQHAGVAGGKTVWWTWTAPSTAKVTISTERSGFDTLLGVYTGTAVGSLTAVASNDNDGTKTTSKVSFTPVAGTAYQIAVDGKAGVTGQVTLSVLQSGSGAYALTDLGASANYPGPSQANDINATGEVVGWVEQTGPVRKAFRWTSSGGFIYLPTLGGTNAEARAINGNGDAVGWAEVSGNTNRNAVLWKKDGTTTDLGRLPGWSNCVALGVNDSLQVVGECSNSTECTNPRAFSWLNGVISDLGATDNGYSSARAITNGGRIVGKSSIVGNRGSFRAVEWRNGVPVELTTYESAAYDINEIGQIVGAIVVNFTFHPMLIQSGTVSDLAPAGGYGPAVAINGKGDILATSSDTAVLYRANAFTMLNSVVAWDSCGGNLYSALAINDSGEIVGQLSRMAIPHAYRIKRPSTTLAPTADAHVRDGTSASTNFGTLATMEVKLSTTTGNNRWSYFKFDTSSVSSSISSAKLRVYGALSGTTATVVNTQVFSCSSTSWSETGLTWNNKPATGTSAQATVTLANSTTFQYYEWDVTNYVKAEKLAGRNVVTLVLKNAVSSDPYTKWSSREASANRPHLVITP